MDKIDLQEKIWGFIFGIAAIIAAILEMFANGMSAASLLGAIKDVFGTAVVVVVFYLVIKNTPKKPKNLKEQLEAKIDTWGLENSPLIFKTEGYVPSKDSPYTQGFVLLQDPKQYPTLVGLKPEDPRWIDYAQYKSPKHLTGKFLDMPSYEKMTLTDFDVLFVMEQTHFENINLNEFFDSIVDAIRKKYKDKIKVDRVGKSSKIKMGYKKIVTNDDVDFFEESLNFVLSLIKVIA